MSTKTTFKRVALVTVAALGFGVMSIVPSSAAVNADSLTVTNGTMAIGDTATATSATVVLSFLPSATSDSMSVTAALLTNVTGNAVLPVLQLVDTVSANVMLVPANSPTVIGLANVGGTTAVASNTPAYVAGKSASIVTTATFKVYLPSVATAGTYTVRVTPAVTSAAGTLTATYKDITIVVAAKDVNSESTSTAYIIAGIVTTADATSDLVAVVAPNTVSTSTQAATIKVTESNAAGTANESLTVTISGPGNLGSSASGTIAASGRALTVMYGSSGTAAVTYIGVFPDGSSGVATISIKGATSGYNFGTKTVLFSGTTVATIVATAKHSVVAVAGTAKTKAISVVAKDSNGYQIYNPTLYVTSASTSIISTSYSNTCTWSATDLVSYCDVTAVATGTASLTVGNKSTAALTTATSNAVSLRVGSTTPATMSLAFDKATYLPGEKATITLSIKDSAGNLVSGSADNTTYSNVFDAGIVSNYGFYTGSDTLTAVFAQVSATTNTKTWTVFMPLSSGTVTIEAVASSSFSAAYVSGAGASVTASAVVGNNSGVDAATDAANEATDAANAATDAANAAAEAADAATAAAQDAADAVAALSTQVAELISALKAQITSLTNLVIKIQKKIKA